MLPKQKAYKNVLDRACRELNACTLEEQARRASVRLIPSTAGPILEVPFFDEIIALTLPDCRFESRHRRNVSLVSKIVILHYIVKASGRTPLGGTVSFEDIPGCRPYLPVFERRVCRPLLAAFGRDRDLFGEAGSALGGTEENYGNASFTLKALPMVPITFILWEGDEEFPPSMKVLFDPTIDGYLPLEDITVISKLAANRILQAARLKAME